MSGNAFSSPIFEKPQKTTWLFMVQGLSINKQLQAFHVVFGRACGATLTTLNAKKIPLSSAFSMLQLALCLLDCAVWEHHLAF